MPYSYQYFKTDVKDHFESKLSKDIKILDIGPGCGTYSDLLSPLGFKLDGLEIYEPYITQFDLRSKYNSLHLGDIMDFDFYMYDYLIMGDILEHLTISNAQIVLSKIKSYKIKTLVAVPYEYEQGEWGGNIYEAHLQPELTPELMKSYYPDLKLLVGDENYGYYINY
jgi:hypothetical protein